MSAATRSVRWCRYGWSGPRGSCKRRRPRPSGSCSTAAPASPSDCGSGVDAWSKRSGRISPKSRRQGKVAVFTPTVKAYSHFPPLKSPLVSAALLILGQVWIDQTLQVYLTILWKWCYNWGRLNLILFDQENVDVAWLHSKLKTTVFL